MNQAWNLSTCYSHEPLVSSSSVRCYETLYFQRPYVFSSFLPHNIQLFPQIKIKEALHFHLCESWMKTKLFWPINRIYYYSKNVVIFYVNRYTLNTYKIKKKSIVMDVNEPIDTSYLKLPSSGDLPANKTDLNSRFVLRKGELCRIKTGLYSTKFTQNSMF